MAEARLLVGTLYCGENEWPRARAALDAQTFTGWSSFVIANRPNKEAHDALYRRFMEEGQAYTHWLKLDADMVLRRPGALAEALAVFEAHEGLDHLMLDVHDWYTDALMPGIQMFTRRARWAPSPDGLMVDPSPQVPGDRLRLDTAPAPIVDHSPDPLPLHAFRFGVHRMLKALQPDRPLAEREFARARLQWDTVKAVWRNFDRRRDPRLGLAVLGADWVLREGGLSIGYEYASPQVEQSVFPEFSSLDAEAMHARLVEDWGDAASLDRTWDEWLHEPD